MSKLTRQSRNIYSFSTQGLWFVSI